jgi:hypothetical protein
MDADAESDDERRLIFAPNWTVRLSKLPRLADPQKRLLPAPRRINRGQFFSARPIESYGYIIKVTRRAIANLNASGLWIYFSMASFFSRSICCKWFGPCFDIICT